jgi:hypothetical protein
MHDRSAVDQCRQHINRIAQCSAKQGELRITVGKPCHWIWDYPTVFIAASGGCERVLSHDNDLSELNDGDLQDLPPNLEHFGPKIGPSGDRLAALAEPVKHC